MNERARVSPKFISIQINLASCQMLLHLNRLTLGIRLKKYLVPCRDAGRGARGTLSKVLDRSHNFKSHIK